MSKPKEPVMAQAIGVTNCECCGGVHILMWREGEVFGVAAPATAEAARSFAADLLQAAKLMAEAKGRPHVH